MEVDDAVWGATSAFSSTTRAPISVDSAAAKGLYNGWSSCENSLGRVTTRYLGFKCFLFSVYRGYPEVEDGRGTFDLVCAFAVLFGVLEAWKCFADS